MKKRKRVSLLTPQERAAQRERQLVLEARIRLGEVELAASGSPLLELDRRERLDYSIRRIQAELEA